MYISWPTQRHQDINNRSPHIVAKTLDDENNATSESGTTQLYNQFPTRGTLPLATHGTCRYLKLMQFDFGKNWADFSEHALTHERIAASRKDFLRLTEGITLRDASFLDIGFGQGLSLLNAAAAGAQVMGLDINPTCGDVLNANQKFYPELAGHDIPHAIGSILDSACVHRLRTASPSGRGYDVVHSWGVLHHTGDMATAVRHAASLINGGGTFVLALYNTHWSNYGWLAVKAAYARFPHLRKPLVWSLYPVIAGAKALATGQNPFRKERGMGFYHDVVDWVGGYPYEWESAEETRQRLEAYGFTLLRCTPPATPTGCNEFVFRKD